MSHRTTTSTYQSRPAGTLHSTSQATQAAATQAAIDSVDLSFLAFNSLGIRLVRTIENHAYQDLLLY
eukprot:1346953-Amorphochlora_amoeboformis.AAC.1